MRYDYEKMLLIYVYMQCGESNAKTFDAIVTNKEFDRRFGKFSNDENNEFLRNYFTNNNLNQKDFKVIGKDFKKPLYDDNGVPVLVYRKHKKKKGDA